MIDFFEFSNELLCLADDRGYFTRVNRAWTKTLGWSAEELTSRPYLDFVHPDDIEATIQEAKLLQSGSYETIWFENRYRCPDGTYRWLAWQVVLEPNTHQLVAAARDISQSKAAEEALREAEERFRAFMDNSPAIAWAKDEQGRFIYVNKALQDHFQIRLADWLGKTDFDFFPKEIAQVFWDNDRKVLENGQPLQVTEESLSETEKRRYWFNNKFLFQDRATRRFVGGVGFDITPLKQAEQALRSQQKLLEESNRDLEDRVAERTKALTETNEKLRLEFQERVHAEEKLQQQQSQLAHVSRLSTIGQMAAELAHEINQPLSAIGNYIYGVLHSVRTGDVVTNDLIATLRQLEIESGRAANIIRRVRNFTRRSAPQPEGVSLNDLVRGVFRLTAAEARHRNIEMQVKLDDNLPTILIDPLQIEQVIVNLVRNAFDALQDGAHDSRIVILETRIRRDNVEVAVHDNGPGLTEDNRERIFEPFFTTKHDGLGLGLAISRSIVEGHQGRLWAEPRLPRGTAFRFFLPVAATKQS